MRNAASSGNREHIRIAVILARKGNRVPIRREDRRRFDSNPYRQSCGMAAFAIDAPEIARIVENNLGLAQCRALQQMELIA